MRGRAAGRPLAVARRWERDGRRVAVDRPRAPRRARASGSASRNDGEPLDDGSYQYIATDSNGDESAAGGIVVGAARIEQRFRNDGDDADLRGAHRAERRAATSRSTCSTPQPIAPGATITLPVADVEQDVETMSCCDDEVLASFSFQPRRRARVAGSSAP